MTIINLDDLRIRTEDDKKIKGTEFGVLSRGNPQFFRIGPVFRGGREHWAVDSKIGKFYIETYDQTKKDITPLAKKLNETLAKIQKSMTLIIK